MVYLSVVSCKFRSRPASGAKLSDPLRAELMDLLTKGRRVDAMKRYSAASGEDLAMTKRVVELLAPR